MAAAEYLTQEEKTDTIPLWQEAFPEDRPGFLDYYYREKTKDNRILAVREEGSGRVISMVHRNPYRLQVHGRELSSDYIVAVATAKDRRHQGLMRMLLTRMLEDMHGEGMPFCYLMPADRRIYEPFGFAYIYDQEHWEITKEAEGQLEKQKVRTEDANQAARWMQGWLEERYRVFAARDQNYVSRLLAELESEEGWMEFLGGGGRIIGIRCWWGVKEREQRMLLCREDCRKTRKEKTPAIMARITDLQKCLEMVYLKGDSPLDRLEVVLKVEDGFCPWNCGTFLWKIGRGESWLERREQEEAPQLLSGEDYGYPCLHIGIGALAQWIFGYRSLEELDCRKTGGSGSWWQEIGIWEGVFLDEVV